MRILLISALIVSMAGLAHAFDGKRKGFILGAGLGVGVASYSVDAEVDGFDTATLEDTEFGLGSNGGRIGGGLPERFLLCLGSYGVSTSSMITSVTGAVVDWTRTTREGESNPIDIFNRNSAGLDTDTWLVVVTVNGLAY